MTPSVRVDSCRSLDEDTATTTTTSSSTATTVTAVILKSCLKDQTKLEKNPSAEYDFKKVIFDDIQIQEYAQILGDNPAVSDGVPVTIAWKHQNRYNMNINIYEYTREPMRRKGRKQLLISSKRRVQSLVEAGYSFEAIGEAIIEVNRIRNSRLESAQSSGWNGPIDVVSGAVHTTGAAIVKAGRRSSKILTGSLSAAIHALKIKPRRKSVTSPAC